MKTKSREEVIRLLLVDDHTLFRESLRRLLESEAGVEISGDFANAEDALAAVKAGLEFDAALVDYELEGTGGSNGLDLVRKVRRLKPDARVLMVTAGTRLNFRLGHQRADGWDTYHNLKPFVQGLVGFAHGFDSAFPDKAGFIQSSANSIALLAGLGLDYKYRKHLSFRVIQADYGYTRLPNLAGNDQNLLRISSGITIHLR